MRSLGGKRKSKLKDQVGFSQNSIEVDPYDIRAFAEIKATSSKLLKSEEAGSADYEQFPKLQEDMFAALFKNDPQQRESWQIERDYLLNQKIMKEIMESSRYKELRVMTSLDEMNAAVGTELMADETQKLVKDMKAERDALQKAVDAGKRMDAAQAAANAAGAGGTDIAGTAEGIELDEAKEQYEKFMEQFEELTERRDFEQQINKMVAKVKDEVKETSDVISNWGLGASASFQNRSAHEKMKLLERLRNSKLKKIADKAGRFKRLASLHRKERVKVGQEETYGIKQGNDVSKLISSEMLRFLNKHTRKQVMLDIIEGKALNYEIRGKETKGKGPIVICLDSSGSMSGTPEIWAKAVAVTLLEIAREQKRDFYCIHFSSGWRGDKLHTNEFLKTDPFDIEKIIDMAEYFEGGGTEFEPPLSLAQQKIGNDQKYRKADIVFVTDGQSAVRDEWLTKFKEWKKNNKVNIYSVLIDSYDNAMVTLKQFSDRVDKLSNLNDTQDEVAIELFVDM